MGSPEIVNEKTIKAAELVDKIYDQERGGAGGHAHIVVDDWNLSDGDIDFCLQQAKDNKFGFTKEQTVVEIEALTMLKGLSEKERYSALAIQEEIIKIQ